MWIVKSVSILKMAGNEESMQLFSSIAQLPPKPSIVKLGEADGSRTQLRRAGRLRLR